jgi:hypothetical protein
MVKYIDYNDGEIPLDNVFWPFTYKRRSFEHERELRALVLNAAPSDKHTEDSPHLNWTMEPINVPGIAIKVDIPRLIERIYVAPTSPDWFKSLVAALLMRYGLNVDVVHSSLDDEPVW